MILVNVPIIPTAPNINLLSLKILSRLQRRSIRSDKLIFLSFRKPWWARENFQGVSDCTDWPALRELEGEMKKTWTRHCKRENLFLDKTVFRFHNCNRRRSIDGHKLDIRNGKKKSASRKRLHNLLHCWNISALIYCSLIGKRNLTEARTKNVRCALKSFENYSQQTFRELLKKL